MIYGERIRLRAVEREDLPRFQRWINDPEVIAGLTIDWPLSLADEEAWFEAVQKRPQKEKPLVIEVREGDTWKPIGNLGFHKIEWDNGSAEVGIMIGEKDYWNQGYGSEALRLLVQYGFETMRLHRIWLRVMETNPRAIRAYEKIGFVHEGRMREAQFAHGAHHDILLMSILRPEWKKE